MDPNRNAELANKASEILTSVAKVKDLDEAKALVFQMNGLFHEAKEGLTAEIAKVDAKKALEWAIPFIPAPYQRLARVAVMVLGLTGGSGWLGSILAKPEPEIITAPPAQETIDLAHKQSAELAKVAAELESAKATIAATDKAMQEAAAKVEAATKEAMKPRKLIGRDAQGKVRAEIGL